MCHLQLLQEQMTQEVSTMSTFGVWIPGLRMGTDYGHVEWVPPETVQVC